MSKKKGKKGGNAEEDVLKEKVYTLQCQIKTQQQKIVWEQERQDQSKAYERDLQNRMVELHKEFNSEKDKLKNITFYFSIINNSIILRDNMTKQYKQMQEDLTQQITDLKTNVDTKKQKIIQQEEEKINMIDDFENQLKKKDEDIVDLKRKIEDMSNEFARMLRETLDKMQDRIELAQWDTESDPQMIKKLKDVVGIQNN